MSVHRNNKAVASIFRGEQPIGKAYRGDRLVFQKGGGDLDFLNFTAVEDGSSVKYTKGTYESAEYSYDKVSWADANSVVISLNKGQKVYFRGNIDPKNKSQSGYAYFTMTGSIAGGGSIQSLLKQDPLYDSNAYKWGFVSMFRNCRSLVKAPLLSAKSTSPYCYRNMFEGCTMLESIEIQATYVGESSCYGMFQTCVHLKNIKAHFERFYNAYSLEAWLFNASANGTFQKKAGVTYPSGNSGIPSGWTVVEF